MPKLTRPSPALVIACLALFVAGGGGAWAASGPLGAARVGGTKSAAPAKKARRGPRGYRGKQGLRGIQGAAGAPGALGATGATGPSDGYVTRVPTATALPPGVDTTLVQLTLPTGGAYVVTAGTELGNTSATAGFASCALREAGTAIGAGSASIPMQNVFFGTVTLTGATTGGVISLTCNLDNAGQGRNSVITAVKVGTLHTQ
jgi:collagen type I/II/III/V/XI/XXIV/XXVII alpha